MNELTAKDLMIGDYVIRKNVPKEILIVDAIDSIRNIVYLDLDGLGITEKIENIEPISITAEILKKNGFVKVDGAYQDVFYCCDGLDLLIDDRLEPCGYTLYGVLELQIKYVHELQHALRLCGINKEIKL